MLLPWWDQTKKSDEPNFVALAAARRLNELRPANPKRVEADASMIAEDKYLSKLEGAQRHSERALLLKHEAQLSCLIENIFEAENYIDLVPGFRLFRLQPYREVPSSVR